MMSGDKVWVNTSLEPGQAVVDGYSGATSLGHAAAGNVASVVPMMDSFWGFEAGSIGETSAFACLIGAAILIITGIGSWRIMLAVLLGGVTMSAIFNAVGPSLGNEYMQIPVLHQLMLGSFMFGLVFMATDPVTAAQTENGKWIYGFLIGVMAMLIRVVNPGLSGRNDARHPVHERDGTHDRPLRGPVQHQAPVETGCAANRLTPTDHGLR
jgi:Na+-transporting NADH:ubiquinone oxidoreductase subunit B